jgi:serine/threonine protein kinase
LSDQEDTLPVPELRAGSKFRNRYVIDRLLGEGGMGSVYQAHDVLLNRAVAIKTLREHLFLNRNSLMRLGREARAISHLNHPNIVKVLDLAGLDDGHPYIVMEYVPGGELSDFIKESQFLDEQTFLDLVFQICAALSHAHEHRILHRDLKPSNILLEHSPDGPHIKLLDFSFAMFIDEEQKLTRSGEFLGTPYYMSPEQCQGARLDVRSDVYSLGCCMYEMLTGTPPFVGQSTYKTVQMHLNEEPFRLTLARTDLPHGEAIERIIEKALAKEPGKRHQSIQDLRHELRNLTGSSSQVSKPENASESSFLAKLPVGFVRKATLWLAAGAVFSLSVGWMVYKVADRSHSGAGPAPAVPLLPVSPSSARHQPQAVDLSPTALQDSALAGTYRVWLPADSTMTDQERASSSALPERVRKLDEQGQRYFDSGDFANARMRFNQGLKETRGMAGKAAFAPFRFNCELVDLGLAQGVDASNLKSLISAAVSTEFYKNQIAVWDELMHSQNQLRTAVDQIQANPDSVSMQNTWLEIARTTNHRVMQVLEDLPAQSTLQNADILEVTRLNERLLNLLENSPGSERDRSLRLEHLRALVLYQSCLRASRQDKQPISINDGLCRKLINDVREPAMVVWLALIAESFANRRYTANADVLTAAFADYATSLNMDSKGIPPQELEGLAWAKLGTGSAFMIKHDYDNAAWWFANAKEQFAVLAKSHISYLSSMSGELVGEDAARKGVAECDICLACLQQGRGNNRDAAMSLAKTLKYCEEWKAIEDEVVVTLGMLSQCSQQYEGTKGWSAHLLKRAKAIRQRNELLFQAISTTKPGVRGGSIH